LAEQWVDEAKQKFDIPLSAIGRISDGCRNIGSILTTAHPQSLITSGAISGLERVFGTVVLDECQYGGADSYRSAVTAFHARYRIGTSANPSRQDGIEKLIHAIFGPVLIRREREESERVGSVLPVMLRVVPYNSHRILPRGVANRERALLQDPDRTGVLDWVVETAPKPALIVCRLRESVDILQKRYNEQAPFQGRVGRMVGQRTRVDRDEFASAMAGLPSGAMDLAVATWSACGVGTNIPGLRSLIMATPPGRGERGYLAYNQNRGRASRLAPDKERGEIYLLWDRSRVRGVATQCWEWNDRQGEIWTGTGWKRVGEWDLVG
jgi:superfamily II DNA or RNA helicase